MISFEKNAKPRYYECFIDKDIIISALIESDEDLFVYVPEIQAEIIPSHVVKEQYGISEKPLSEYIGRYRQREITNLLDRYKKGEITIDEAIGRTKLSEKEFLRLLQSD